MIGGIGGNTSIANTCNFGVYLTNTNNMSPNQVSIKDSTIAWCKRWGIHFENGNMLMIEGIQFENNGTLVNGFADLNSGALKVSGNLNIEQDVALININKCWFESNYGYSLFCYEDSIGVIFNLVACHFKDYSVSNNSALGVYLAISSNYLNKVNVLGCNCEIPLYQGSVATFAITSNVINIIGSNLLNNYFSTTPNIIG